MNALPYAVTILVSAFLLFQIEPILAKIILPWFGGSAAVWTTCVLFFQIILLLGYAYAHLLIRRAATRWQVYLHVSLLACSLIFLPAIPRASWQPSGAEEPTLRIILLLSTTVGLPYFLLSATSPLLQAWYSRQHGGDIPYRLFALSNFGSMLALLSYPIAVEPALETRTQAIAWSVLYAGFVVLCGSIALVLVSRAKDRRPQTAALHDGRPTWKRQLLWLALTACASTMLLAVTNQLTQNVAAVPLLWVLPLALYLVSFILCFADRGFYRRAVWLPLTAASLACLAYLGGGDRQMLSPAASIPLYLGGMFCCSMTLHGELVRFKPHPEYLTSFYLMSSLGGAVGGVFVGVIAPHLFSQYSEMPVALVWCAFLIYVIVDHGRFSKVLWLSSLAGSVALAYYVSPRTPPAGRRLEARNFYGVLQVSDGQGVRILTNGIINHGSQFLDATLRLNPTTYYGTATGLGLALREHEGAANRRVGIIGLGTGTIATYGRPGDVFRFYEINPLVLAVAKSEFSYLNDTKAGIDVVLGDARLSLEREPKQNFDVLVVDAFTSDAIPVHLLTREAFGVYASHLKRDGVLAVHVSNAHLDLPPIVQMSADAVGWHSVVVNSAGDDRRQISAAIWVLASARGQFFEYAAATAAVQDIPRDGHLRPWTDGRSNLWEILR